MNYDLLVIGGEREGIDRAISVAGTGRRVAVIGTSNGMPSFDFTRHAAKNIIERRGVSIESWRTEVARLMRRQFLADEADLKFFDVQCISGDASFVSPDAVEVSNGHERRILTGDQIVVACGSRSCWPSSLRGDQRFVFSVESLLALREIPNSIIIIGAGRTGTSAAMMLAAMGIEVTVVDEDASVINAVDISRIYSPIPPLPNSSTAEQREASEMNEADPTQSFHIAFRLGNEAVGVELHPDLQVAVRLANGDALVADAALVCVGWEGKTQGLNLEAAGVGLDERGRIWCNDAGQTWAPRISAVGDVIGFPRKSGIPAGDFQCLSTKPTVRPAARAVLAIG